MARARRKKNTGSVRVTEADLEVLRDIADHRTPYSAAKMDRDTARRLLAATFIEDAEDPRVAGTYYIITTAGKTHLLKQSNPRGRKHKNKEEPTVRVWDIHYKKAYFQGRHVLTIEAGTPQEAFRRAQTLAQRGVRGLAGLVEHPRSAFQISPAREQAQANPLYLVVPWGSPYGPGPHYKTSDGKEVTMYRKGQKVRFYDRSGHQVGPEQSNVAPAVAFAHSQGWRSLVVPTRHSSANSRLNRLKR